MSLEILSESANGAAKFCPLCATEPGGQSFGRQDCCFVVFEERQEDEVNKLVPIVLAECWVARKDLTIDWFCKATREPYRIVYATPRALRAASTLEATRTRANRDVAPRASASESTNAAARAAQRDRTTAPVRWRNGSVRLPFATNGQFSRKRIGRTQRPFSRGRRQLSSPRLLRPPIRNCSPKLRDDLVFAVAPWGEFENANAAIGMYVRS
jgi:hypothetical protein